MDHNGQNEISLGTGLTGGYGLSTEKVSVGSGSLKALNSGGDSQNAGKYGANFQVPINWGQGDAWTVSYWMHQYSSYASTRYYNVMFQSEGAIGKNVDCHQNCGGQLTAGTIKFATVDAFKDQWVLLTFTFEKTNSNKVINIYKNGELIKESTESGWYPDAEISNHTIGGGAAASNSQRLGFGAYFDDFRIYNKALTADEVAQLYAPDTDGDGISDAQEVIDGTDPRDHASLLTTPIISSDSGASLAAADIIDMADGSQVMIFKYDAASNNGQGQTEYTIDFPANVVAETLIVGGGGAGANRGAGGGGGDALLYTTRDSDNPDRNGEALSLPAGTYTIKVGDGGTRPPVNVDASVGQSGKSSGITGNGISIYAGGGGHGGATLSGGIESASLLASPGIEHTNSDGSTSIGGGGGNYARASFILANTNPAVDRTQGLGVSGDGGTGGDPSAANILYAGGGGGASSTGHGGDGDNGSSASGKRSGQGGRGIATDISGTRPGYGGGGGGGTWIGNVNGEGLVYTETIDGQLITFGGGKGSRDRGAAPLQVWEVVVVVVQPLALVGVAGTTLKIWVRYCDHPLCGGYRRRWRK